MASLTKHRNIPCSALPHCAIDWSMRFLLVSIDAGVHSGEVVRVPNTTNLWFDHLEGEALVIALDLKGLAVSGGSACASGASEPSHVLTAMGVTADARARQSSLQSFQADNRRRR